MTGDENRDNHDEPEDGVNALADVPEDNDNNGRKHLLKTTVFVGVFGGFSWLTTAGGAASVVSEMLGPVGSWIAGLGFSAVISSAIFVFYSAFFHRRRALLFAIFLCIGGLVGQVSSAIFASASIRFAQDAPAFQAEKDMAGLTTVLEPLEQIRENALGDALSLRNFSSNAHDLSLRETNYGDTCDGQETTPVCDLRCRMRQRLSQEAQSKASLAEQVSQSAVQIVSRSAAINDDEAWRQIYLDAANIRNDPRTREIRDWATATLSDFRNGFTDEETGREFVCRDATTESALTALIAQLDSRPDFPASPPPRVKASFADATEANLTALSGWISHMLGFQKDFDREGASRMIGPLTISVIVEFFVFLGLYLLHEPHRKSELATAGPRPAARPNFIDGTEFLGADLDPDKRAAMEQLIWIFDNCLIIEDGVSGKPEVFFAQPLNADDPQMIELAKWAVRTLDLPPARVRGPVDLAQVAPFTAELLRKRIKGARIVRLWQVPPSIEKRIRDVACALGPAGLGFEQKQMPA